MILTAIANLTGVFFGGLAGNQGGLRSAALSTFALAPKAFVATSTATGLLVDLARTPVYAAISASDLLRYWPPIGMATVGVLAGTLVGERLLVDLSPATFRRILASAVGTLGLWRTFASA